MGGGLYGALIEGGVDDFFVGVDRCDFLSHFVSCFAYYVTFLVEP